VHSHSIAQHQNIRSIGCMVQVERHVPAAQDAMSHRCSRHVCAREMLTWLAEQLVLQDCFTTQCIPPYRMLSTAHTTELICTSSLSSRSAHSCRFACRLGSNAPVGRQYMSAFGPWAYSRTMVTCQHTAHPVVKVRCIDCLKYSCCRAHCEAQHSATCKPVGCQNSHTATGQAAPDAAVPVIGVRLLPAEQIQQADVPQRTSPPLRPSGYGWNGKVTEKQKLARG
jgi:hypothetical protein